MRCYDGCPDDELKAVLDAKAAVHRRLRKAGLHATWFPGEEAWMVFRDHRAVTGFHADLQGAATAALG